MLYLVKSRAKMTEVITIDGPSASGKSTIGFLLAKRIGFTFIDSGSAYRAGCVVMLERGVTLDEPRKIEEIFYNLDLEFKMGESTSEVFMSGEKITHLLNTPLVDAIVSPVSALPIVRESVNRVLHRVGMAKNTVMAGRDIGTVVFPEAKYKFFITALAEARAKRRVEQLRTKGFPADYEAILHNIEDRDRRDSSRSVAPLKIPEGSVVVDTSEMTIKETVMFLEKYLSC